MEENYYFLLRSPIDLIPEASFGHSNANFQFSLEIFSVLTLKSSVNAHYQLPNTKTRGDGRGDGEGILLSNQTIFQKLLLKRSVKHFSTLIIFKTFNESSLLNK